MVSRQMPDHTHRYSKAIKAAAHVTHNTKHLHPPILLPKPIRSPMDGSNLKHDLPHHQQQHQSQTQGFLAAGQALAHTSLRVGTRV